ncbi:MAG: cadmium-translocating P-type ATPase [Ruminococcaceae bacterium]|nr:cadmium-translocating P-type ATPase [Oscillospiraceae bacterium]
MTRKQKRMLLRIVLAAGISAVLLFVRTDGILRLLLWLIPYLIIGYDILLDAVRGLFGGQLLDENFLMAVATIGALALAIWGRGDYTEAVAVMLFYQIGELFQSYALGKSRKSISALMDIRPERARVELDGRVIECSPEDVEVGSVIIVDPGERVAIDGVVEGGESELDTSALTGESIPRSVGVGDEVLSASVNMSAPLRIRTTRPYGESAVARILDLVENASSHKSRSERFITRFARVYTPAVCIAALLLAFVPHIIIWAVGGESELGEWIYRALSFLVISCPCALVISIPMGFFASLGGAGREGILVKGSNYLEMLAKVKRVAFDKTGTLTEGRIEVEKIRTLGIEEEKLLYYAAHAEIASSHPIARGIERAYERSFGIIDRGTVCDVRETAGRGISAKVDGICVSVSNTVPNGAEENIPDGSSVVYVSVGGAYCGYILLADSPRESSALAVNELLKMGISVTMLTGDRAGVGKSVADSLGIIDARCELLPDGKVRELEDMLESTDGKVAFVGDGINDAPVLARADVGVAMGGIGSEAASAAADVVIMDDDPMKIARAIAIAKKCVAIAKQNIVFSIGVKLLCLALVALGVAGMHLAIFADVGVLVIAVLNSMRGLK